MARLPVQVTLSDRNMLDLLSHKYRQAGFRCTVFAMEEDAALSDRALCYRIETKKGGVYQFVLHKYKGGPFRALWGIEASFALGTLETRDLDPLGCSHAIGLANALGEAERLMSGTAPPMRHLGEFHRAFGIAEGYAAPDSRYSGDRSRQNESRWGNQQADFEQVLEMAGRELSSIPAPREDEPFDLRTIIAIQASMRSTVLALKEADVPYPIETDSMAMALAVGDPQSENWSEAAKFLLGLIHKSGSDQARKRVVALALAQQHVLSCQRSGLNPLALVELESAR